MIYVPKKGDIVDADFGYGNVTSLIFDIKSKTVIAGYRWNEKIYIQSASAEDYKEAKIRGNITIDDLEKEKAVEMAIKKFGNWDNLHTIWEQEDDCEKVWLFPQDKNRR